jgi:predicted transcriptional regulator of viral defense system
VREGEYTSVRKSSFALTCVMKNANICVIKNANGEFMRRSTYVRFETEYRNFKGYVRTKELRERGFSNRQIIVLTEEGYLEKICHGHYWVAVGKYKKPWDYKCIEICLSDPKAVICLDSALYYQGLIETEPKCLSVATERTDRSLMKMSFPIKRHYFSDSNFKIGVKKKNTGFGCYNIYDIERSVCDMIRLESEFTIEIVESTKCNEEQYQRLLKYIELFKIKQKF